MKNLEEILDKAIETAVGKLIRTVGWMLQIAGLIASVAVSITVGMACIGSLGLILGCVAASVAAPLAAWPFTIAANIGEALTKVK